MSRVSMDWEEFKEKHILDEEDRIMFEFESEILRAFIEARMAKKITQKQFEELVGIKQPMIARIENGETMPRVDTLLKMLAPLGLTLKVVPKDKKSN